MTISISPFTTSRISDDTYSLTLAQLTSVFIAELERLLGPRNPKFTYTGLEFDTTPNAGPHIWFLKTGYPGHETDQYPTHITIRLTEAAQNDANLAIWQLAHECVHLIDPWNTIREGRPSNYLEEGLATWYQNTIIQDIAVNHPAYEEATSLVQPHMPELAATVKHLRTNHYLRISAIDAPGQLLRHFPEMDSRVAEGLCQRFETD